MARSSQSRGRCPQNSRQLAQPVARSRSDRTRILGDQGAVHVRETHNGRALPASRRRLRMVDCQAAVRRSWLALQVKGHVPSRHVGHRHHVLPAVDCKSLAFFFYKPNCQALKYFTNMCTIGHQRSLVLCSANLQGLGPIRDHYLAVGKWCCRHRHVVRYHSCRPIRRQSRPQAYPHRRCNRYVTELAYPSIVYGYRSHRP